MIDNQKNKKQKKKKYPNALGAAVQNLREEKNVFIQVGHQLHALYIGLASTIFFFFVYSYY